MSQATASVFPGRRAHSFAALLFAIWLFLAGAAHARGQQTEAADGTSAAKASASVPSNGVNPRLAQLAQHQGRAESEVLDWVLANSGPIRGDLRMGELRIAFTVTPAEGWWDKAGGGKLAWHEAPARSMHLRIFVIDQADGRLLPGLSVHAKLVDANGNEQSAPADFGWYPMLNAYGGNLPLDADSSYTLHVTVDPLLSTQRFADDERLLRATVAEFPPVQISQDAVAQLAPATTIEFNNEAELLKPCNAALSAAITALWQRSESGSEKAAGDYFVGYALEDSALLPPNPEAKLRFWNMLHLTGMTDVRVVLFPRDSRTGRLIPGLKPQVSFIAADGKQYTPGEMPLTLHPWFNHYGHNVRLPRNGAYKLHVHFDAPGFRRWGGQSERFASAVDVEFDNVSLKEEAKN